MAKKAVFGLAESESHAESIIDALKSAGFSNGDISVLYPDSSGTRGTDIEHHTKAPEGATTGAGTGTVIGGTLGWLAGIGSLAIPGIGPFIAAGPIMATLGGAAIGGTVGGITGALVGMGIPEYEARAFEGKLKEGKVLISVHTDDKDERDRAKHILEEEDAEDIGIAGEEHPDKKKDKDEDARIRAMDRDAMDSDAVDRDSTRGRRL